MNDTIFTTNDGTAWPLSLSLAKVRELRDVFAVDLLAERNAREQLAELFDDGPKLAAVLWHLLADDWRVQLGETDAETFFDSLDCDSLSAGAAALIGAYKSFLPEPKTANGGGEPDGNAGSPWEIAMSLAGIAGVDPWPLTFRELVKIAETVQSERWDHTAILRTEIRNAAFGRKQAAKFKDCHPFYNRKPKQRLSKAASGRMLNSMFTVWKS